MVKISKLILTNSSDFIQEMYRFTLDRSKLKFDRLSLDMNFYQESLKEYLIKNFNELERGAIINIKVINKNNSFLNQDITFPFKITGAVDINKKKKGTNPLYRVRLKFLIKDEKPKRKR